MNCNPTLSSDEFKTIHNGLCQLDSVVGRLEDVLKPELYAKLAEAAAEIRKGLAGAYKQENQSYTTKHDHYTRVKTDLGLDAIWSIYEVDNFNETHPFEGAKEVVYRDHWGEKTVRVPIYDGSWWALYVAANAAIRDSGDDHHIFIEHFTQNGDELILSTGS